MTFARELLDDFGGQLLTAVASVTNPNPKPGPNPNSWPNFNTNPVMSRMFSEAHFCMFICLDEDMARILLRGKLVNTGKGKQSSKRPENVHKQHSSAGIAKRKGRKLNLWNEARMKEAIKKFKEGNKCLHVIPRAWQVPKTTLARRVKADGLAAGYKHASGKRPVLPQSVEKELVDHITLLAKRGFPLSPESYPENCI